MNNLNNPNKKDYNFKNFYLKTASIFSNAYTIFILSNLSNSLMLPEKSAYEKLCIFIEDRDDDNNFNYLDLKIYYIFNIYGQNIFKYFNEDLVDYLITNIWSGLFLTKDTNPQNIFSDNKKIILKTIINLLHFREIGLINSLLHISYSKDNLPENLNFPCLIKLSSHDSIKEDLECSFIRLIAFSKIDNRKKFIKELNNYISLISDVTPDSELDVKSHFIEFYSNFLNTRSDFFLIYDKELNNSEYIKKKQDTLDFNLNFKLLTFYLLEDYLIRKSFLNLDLKFDFYYNSFNFIFPLIKNKQKPVIEQKIQIYFGDPRDQKFLINFLNSCLQVDFDLSITFYLSIIDDISCFPDFNKKMQTLFVEYLIAYIKKPKKGQFFNPLNYSEKNYEGNFNYCAILNAENTNEPSFSNNFLIEKIILSDPRLLTSICLLLEEECLNIKINHKLSVYFGIKESLIKKNLEDFKMDVKLSLNLFYLLHKIYSDMKDYHNSSRISLLYIEALDDIIKNNILTLDEMIKIYNEKNISLQNLAFTLKKIANKKSSIYLLKLRKINSPNNGKLINYKNKIHKK